MKLPIEFSMYAMGYDEKTVLQMYNDWAVNNDEPTESYASHPSPTKTAIECWKSAGNNPDNYSQSVKEAMEEYLQQYTTSHASHLTSSVEIIAEKHADKLYDKNAKTQIMVMECDLWHLRKNNFKDGVLSSSHPSPMSAEQVGLGYYYPLFKFFADEHGLTLLDSQMQDVIHECKKFIEPATTGENWKTEYDNCRALLQELVSLKVMRENLYKGNPDGKEYAERKPKAWQAAQQFLSTYQHEGLSTTPSVKADGWVSVEDGLPECNEKFGDSDYYSCKDENSSGTPFVAWYNNKTNVWKLAHHAVPNISVNVTHYRSL